jgi:hypothetical protein
MEAAASGGNLTRDSGMMCADPRLIEVFQTVTAYDTVA